MRTLSAGPGGNRLPGLVYDVPPAEAEALVAGGYAEPVDRAPAPAVPETTAAALPENAARPRATPRPAGRRK